MLLNTIDIGRTPNPNTNSSYSCNHQFVLMHAAPCISPPVFLIGKVDPTVFKARYGMRNSFDRFIGASKFEIDLTDAEYDIIVRK